jgi:hypothetical protein
MINSINYEYRAPNSAVFWRGVEANRPTMSQTLTDWNPPSGSLIGTWQFRFTTHWMSNAQWGNISAMSAMTHININFLVPFGVGL